MKKYLLGGAGVLFGLALTFSIVAPAQASTLTSAQVQAIVGLLQSFGADQSVINNVSVALGGSSSGSQSCSAFADLKYGDFDDDSGGRVSQLQTWLGIPSNTFGFGTYGNKTRAAWQSRCGGGTNVTFSASPTYGVAPLRVVFRAGVEWSNVYSVDFGDGQSSTLQNNCPGGLISACGQPTAEHTYTSNGTYSATLRNNAMDCIALTNCGVIGTVTITVTGGTTVGGVPSINGLDAPTSLSVGQTGTWTVHASAPSGTQLRYSVVWGDEGWGTSAGSAQQAQTNIQTSATFTHAYQTAGTYNPTFYVSNDYGSAQASASVVVSNNTQTSTFSAYPAYGYAPLNVNFSYPYNSSTQNGQYTVEFGDGTGGPMSAFLTAGACTFGSTCEQRGSWVANHSYTSNGTYTATLFSQPQFVCNAPPGAACAQMMPARQTVGTVTITVMTGWL